MPKKQWNESVLHDWVCLLPFQQQALLLTAIRGADGLSKHNDAKAIIRYLRGVVIKPAADWAGKTGGLVGANDNDFMWGEYDKFRGWGGNFWHDHDAYPHHFIMHLVHCSEVIGYKHPDSNIRANWLWFYNMACHSFHMNPESEKEMDNRLDDFGEGIHNKKKNAVHS